MRNRYDCAIKRAQTIIIIKIRYVDGISRRNWLVICSLRKLLSQLMRAIAILFVQLLRR